MTRPFRIALLLATPGSTWGGMEKHTRELAQELREHGHEVHVLADARYRSQFSDVTQFHRLPVQYSRRHPWLGWRLRHLLRRIQPDIAHAQGNKAAQLLSNLKRHRPTSSTIYIGTIHGTKSSHRAFARLDGVIAVSSDIGESLDHPSKTVILNGVALPFSTSPTFAPPPERPLVIAVGRLEPVKGFDRLIQAWSRVNPNYRLVILGEGSARSQLEKQIDQLDLGERVKLPGYEHNVSAWLQKADLCVISSEREGFPYILAEALLNRCPVVSTPVSGVRTLLSDEFIASSAEPDDLAVCLTRALEDLTSVRSKQEPAFIQAIRTLTRTAMVEQTLAFYRKLGASIADADRGH